MIIAKVLCSPKKNILYRIESIINSKFGGSSFDFFVGEFLKSLNECITLMDSLTTPSKHYCSTTTSSLNFKLVIVRKQDFSGSLTHQMAHTSHYFIKNINLGDHVHITCVFLDLHILKVISS